MQASKTPQGEPAKANPNVKDKKPKKTSPAKSKGDQLSPAQIMVDFVPANALFHGPDGTPYVEAGRISLKLLTPDFKRHLARQYWLTTKEVASGEHVQAATNILAAQAQYDRPEVPVFLRFAAVGDTRYVALYDAENRVIEIDRTGWRFCDHPPVKFRRPSTARELPPPVAGGSFDELWPLLNVPESNDRTLLMAWMAAVVNALGPVPVLVMTGPQGSAKSTTMKTLQRLLDPHAVEGSAIPKSLRDLAVMAENAALLAFDNVSFLSTEVSDALCRLVTGGAFPARSLYSDDDLKTFSARRPIILNGITDFATKPDLLDRAILIPHDPLPAGGRRTEKELNEAFRAIHGRVLGAVFDWLAGGLREWNRTPKPGDMRMLDFARFAVACEAAGGGPPTFAAAYSQNRSEGQAAALDDNVVAVAVVKFVEDHGNFEGSMTDLYTRLTPQSTRAPAGWPRAPNSLSGILARLAPALSQVHHLDYSVDRSGPGGRKIVTLTKRSKVEEPSSRSSGSSDDMVSPPNERLPLDDPDDVDDEFS